MANILVVDDELGIRDLLSEILNDEGHAVELAENAAQARNARNAAAFDLVLLDIWMPDTDGVSLLKEWAAAGTLSMPVIMMSGHATIDTAVEATRIGAFSFLEKPITLQKLLKAVEQGLARHSLRNRASQTSALSAGNAALGTSAGGGESGRGEAGGLLAATHGGAAAGGHGAASGDGGEAATAAGSVLPARQHFDLDRPLREARDGFEKAYFEFHLSQEGGSMTRVAEKTGLERTHLYRKLRQLGVDLTRSKRSATTA